MDYANMIMGAMFFAVAANLWPLRKETPLFRWKWFIAFAVFGFFNRLFLVASQSLPGLPWLQPAGFLAILGAFACLLEFGRRETDRPFLRLAGLALTTAGVAAGFGAVAGVVPLPLTTVSCAFCFVASGSAAAALFTRHRDEVPSRGGLDLLGAGCIALAVVVALEPQTQHFAENHPFGEEMTWWQVLVYTLQTMPIIALALASRKHHRTMLSRGGSEPFRRRLYGSDSALIAIALLSAVISWTVVERIGADEAEKRRGGLAMITSVAGRTVQPELASRLSWSEADLAKAEYRSLKAWLHVLHEAVAGSRFACLMGWRDGKSYVLVDSEPPDSPDCSPPGQYYTEADPRFLRCLEAHRPFIVGPLHDRWGIWITGGYPLLDLGRAGKVSFTLDFDAASWQQLISRARLPSLVIALLFFMLVHFFFTFWQRTMRLSDLQAQELERVSRQEAAIAVMASSADFLRGDFSVSAASLCRLAADAAGADRVGIWLADGPDAEMKGICLYDENSRDVSVPPPMGRDGPADGEGSVSAPFAANNPGTAGQNAREASARPLQVPVFMEGKAAGWLVFESDRPLRAWKSDEVRFAGEVAGQVANVALRVRREQAEKALLDSERQYRAIFETTGTAMVILDPDSRITLANDEFARLIEMPREEIENRVLWNDVVQFEHSGRAPKRSIACSANGEESVRSELRLRTRQGGIRHVLLTMGAIPATPRRVASLVDITQRRQSEEALVKRLRYEAGTVRCSKTLFSGGLESGKVERALRFLLEAASAGRVYIFRNRHDPVAGVTADMIYEVCAPGVLPSIDNPRMQNLEVEKLFPRWVRLLSEGKAVYGPVNELPPDEQAFFEHLAVSSLAALPIFVNGEWFGVVCFDDVYGQRVWGKEEVRLLRFAAELLGNYQALIAAREEILAARAELEVRVEARTAELAEANEKLRAEIDERWATENALQESEKKYRELVQTLPQIVYELDARGNVTFINPAGFQVAGYVESDVLAGMHILDIVHPDCHENIRNNFAILMSGGRVEGQEYRILRKDRTTFPAIAYSRMVVSNGQPAGVRGFLVDISERKHAEEELRRAYDDLETRVAERTSELAQSNAIMKHLLEKQEVSIELAQHLLGMVDGIPNRHTALHDGWSLFTTVLHIPCYAAGGDHFFLRTISRPGASPCSVLSLKDQSGHDVGCILRSIVTDLIHNALLHSPDPLCLEDVIGRINREICASPLFLEEDFMTSITLEVDHDSLEASYVSTGHPPAFLVRGREILMFPEGGGPGANLPVGLSESQVFSAAHIRLERGDKIIFYTDGLLEIPKSRNKAPLTAADVKVLLQNAVDTLGDCRVSDVVGELVEALFGQRDVSAIHGPFPDDVALLGLEVEPRGEMLEDTLLPAGEEDLAGQMSRLYDRIEGEWAANGFLTPEIRLRVVFDEAVLNAWKHAYQRQPGRPIRVRRWYGNDAALQVEDEGPGFAYREVADPRSFENILKPSGRGIFLIKLYSDDVKWSESGRTITVYFAKNQSTKKLARSKNSRYWMNLWKIDV